MYSLLFIWRQVKRRVLHFKIALKWTCNIKTWIFVQQLTHSNQQGVFRGGSYNNICTKLLHQGGGSVISHLDPGNVRPRLEVYPIQLVVLPLHLGPHVVRHVPQVAHHGAHLLLTRYDYKGIMKGKAEKKSSPCFPPSLLPCHRW